MKQFYGVVLHTKNGDVTLRSLYKTEKELRERMGNRRIKIDYHIRVYRVY